MSNCGNLFVSARVALLQKNIELINYFKEITNYSWYNMNDSNFAFSRCSIFLNFVNSKDLFLVKNIFPKKIYFQIFQICSEIMNKNSYRKFNRINSCNNLKENCLIAEQGNNNSFQKEYKIKKTARAYITEITGYFRASAVKASLAVNTFLNIFTPNSTLKLKLFILLHVS